MARQNKIKSTIIDRTVDVLIYLIVGILSLSCLIPFLHVLAKSISSDGAVMSRQVFIWPVGFNLNSYIAVFEDPSMMRSLGFTVFITVTQTVLQLIVVTCLSYPLTKKELKGRNIVLFYFVVTMYVSGGQIPTYIWIHRLGLINSPWALILPGLVSVYNMIIMRSFIRSTIPESLEEAAYLDGATFFQVLFRIVLPLSKAVLATLALFGAVGRWNGYGDAMYYITKEEYYPLQLKLNNMVKASAFAEQLESKQLEEATTMTSPEVLRMACVMFATIPIICVYPFLQKYFVKGVMIGAVKG